MTSDCLLVFRHFLIILICLQLTSGNIATSSCNDGEAVETKPPDCLDDCAGRRFFLDRDDICKMCVECQPGFQHDKYCGNGENGDAVCIPCPADHYSYNRYDCVACRVCDNTHIIQQCSPSTDRRCGDCLPGFYKDPQNPDFCNQRCEWLSDPDTIPACKEWLASQQMTDAPLYIPLVSSPTGLLLVGEESGHINGTIIIIVIIVLLVILIGGTVIPIYLCYNHFKRPASKTNIVPIPLDDLELDEGHNNIVGDGDTDSATLNSRSQSLSEPNAFPSSSSQGQSSKSLSSEGLGNGTADVEIREQPDLKDATEIVHDEQGRGNVTSNGNKEGSGEDKEPEKLKMDICDSSGESHSPNGIGSISDSEREGKRYNENSYSPVNRAEEYASVHKDVCNTSHNTDKHCPSAMLADGNSSNPQLKIPKCTRSFEKRSMSQHLISKDGEYDTKNKEISTESTPLLVQVSRKGPDTNEDIDSKDSGYPSVMSRPQSLSSKDGEREEAEIEQPLSRSSSALSLVSIERPGDEEHDGSQGGDECQRLLPIHQAGDGDVGAVGGNDSDQGGIDVISHRGPPPVDSKSVQTSIVTPNNEQGYEQNGQNNVMEPDENERLLHVESHEIGATGGDEQKKGKSEQSRSKFVQVPTSHVTHVHIHGPVEKVITGGHAILIQDNYMENLMYDDSMMNTQESDLL